jgi:hypothetical protein
MLVVQDGEEPGAQIGSRLPQMLLGEGADQAVLHQVVSLRAMLGQDRA